LEEEVSVLVDLELLKLLLEKLRTDLDQEQPQHQKRELKNDLN